MEGPIQKELPPLPVLGHRTSKENNVDGSKAPRNWRPKAHGLLTLSLVALTSLSLVIVLQYLVWQGNVKGGILLAPTINDFTAIQTFVYLYLPVVCILVYGMVWTWIDLTAKRLEPYYAMAKPGGAEAQTSLMLDYTSDFILLVPFKAAKLGHWSVFGTAIATLIVSLGLTPFVGSIFNLDTINIVSRAEVQTAGTLLPPDAQANKLNAGLLNAAYATAWMNATSPPFTTQEIVLMPFGLVNGPKPLPTSGSISAETMGYRTNLYCSPAKIDIAGAGAGASNSTSECDGGASLSNNAGCTIAVPSDSIGASGTPYRQFASYTGWYGSAFTFDSLKSNGCPCPAAFANNFLASVGLNDAQFNTSATTYLFCETAYERLRVNATLRIQGWSVQHWTPLAKPELLSSEEFNKTVFDQFLGTAVLALSESDTSLNGFLGSTSENDIGDSFVDPDQASRLKSLRPAATFGQDLSQYAFALNKTSMEILSRPPDLAGVFQQIHRLLFALALRSMIVDGEVSGTVRIGHLDQQLGAVTVSRTFVLIAQCCLAALAAAAVLSYLLNRSRRSNLDRDPSSIASVADLLSPSVTNIVSDFSTFSSETLMRRLQGYRFLTQPHADLGPRVRIEACSFFKDTSFGHPVSSVARARSLPSRDGMAVKWSSNICETSESACQPKSVSKSQRLLRPVELRTIAILAFICGLIGALIGFSILQRIITKSNGLAINTEATFVRNLVLNYIPTLFGTLLEALWILINRAYCVLQPFEDLRRGKAPARTSIGVQYTHIPSQLVIGKALSRRHYILSIVCLIAILANVVSVVLSGLFIVKPATLRIPHDYSALVKAHFVSDPQAAGSQLDYMYPLERNFTDNATLPAWISPNRAFFPIKWSQDMMNNDVVLQGRTLAVQLDPQCVAGNVSFEFPGDEKPDLVVAHKTINNESMQCHGMINIGGLNDGSGIAGNVSEEAERTSIAAESISILLSTSAANAGGLEDPCNSFFAIGWFRAGGFRNAFTLAEADPSLPDLAGTAVTCSPVVTVSQHEVTVNANGIVLNVGPAFEHPDEIQDFFPVGPTGIPGQEYVDDVFRFLTKDYSANNWWHNGTFAADWLNYLLKLRNANADNVDPSLAPPDPEKSAPIVGEILQRIFAIRVGLNRQWLDATNSSTETRTGHLEYTEQRVFFAPYMYSLAMGLFSFNVLIATMILFWRPGRLLSYMPTTIGGVAAYVAGSSFHADLVTGRTTVDDLLKSSSEFGFGVFIGMDRLPHTGIEKQYFIPNLGHETSLHRFRRWIVGN